MYDIRWILSLISSGLVLPEIEQNYRIKSEKAAQIQNVEHQSIIELARRRGVKLRFLIFGPNENSPDYTTHRLPIKTMIEDCIGQIADFPENVDYGPFGDPIQDEITKNPMPKEFLMIQSYDFTIILLMSPGSVSEFSSFLMKKECAEKIRLFIPSEHEDSLGYIMKGPVEMFKWRFSQTYIFRGPEDLLKQVRNMVMYHILYELFN